MKNSPNSRSTRHCTSKHNSLAFELEYPHSLIALPTVLRQLYQLKCSSRWSCCCMIFSRPQYHRHTHTNYMS